MTLRPPRVLAVADSDSYVKWGAHLVDRMPERWERELCVLQTPWMPSAAQLDAALAGTRWAERPPAPISLDRLQGRIAQFRPDAVVVATRGPTVKVIVRTAFATGHRPVIVSGLPGISFPPTRKAVAYRGLADLVVVHSRRERDGYVELAERMGVPQRFALASLPFLATERVEERAEPASRNRRIPTERVEERAEPASRNPGEPPRGDWVSRRRLAAPPQPADTVSRRRSAEPTPETGVGAGVAAKARNGLRSQLQRAPHPAVSDGPIVFAAQAKFPGERHERVALLAALAELARRRPTQRVVIKVRGEVGEAQTHPERHDYRELISEVDPPRNLVIEGGPMSAHLAAASALVTVSSTAILEAIAAGVPVLALQDWGIRRSFVNNGFVGGGFLGSLDDLVGGRFRHPSAEWLDDNWFHAPEAADWVDRLGELLVDRDLGVLPARAQAHGTSGGALRLAWDRRQALGRYDGTALGWLAMVVGTPALTALLTYRRMLRWLRAHGARVAGPAATEEEPDEPFVTPAPA